MPQTLGGRGPRTANPVMGLSKEAWAPGILAALLAGGGAPGAEASPAAEPSSPVSSSVHGTAGGPERRPGGLPGESSESSSPASSQAPPESRTYLLDRLAAGASLGYFTTDRSRILTEIHFDFPFVLIRQKSLFILGSLQTSTFKTGSRVRIGSFEAQDLEYRIEAGARDYLSNRVAIAAFVGQQGREQLDRPGSRQLRYAGLGFESAGFPRPGGDSRFEWRLALGPAFQSQGVDADAVVRGAFLFDLWRGHRSTLGLDGSFDSIFESLQGRTEFRVGPRWTFPLPNGIRATLFSEWIRGRNPLGIEALGWNFGFKYAEGAYAGPHTLPLPDVRGVLAFGRGTSRGTGRFDLDLSSPALRIASKPLRLFANLDADVLAGTGFDTLFFIARAGAEAGILPRLLVGPSIYHRSNHARGQAAAGATSLTIVQATLRTAGWEYANRLPGVLTPDPGTSWTDRMEFSVSPGLITDSSFEQRRSWDLQAGARYDLLPRPRKVVPFLRVFREWGDVHRREASIGFATVQNLVIEVQYRRDDQYLGSDLSDVFLLGSLFF